VAAENGAAAASENGRVVILEMEPIGHVHGGRAVAEDDAIDGTPVLDIKPVMQEFLPRDALRQPAWSHELMRHYWDPEA
jgi:tRNA (Thr-GGU) A37 N-methylase